MTPANSVTLPLAQTKDRYLRCNSSAISASPMKASRSYTRKWCVENGEQQKSKQTLSPVSY